MEWKDRVCPLWTFVVFPFHSHAGCGTAMVFLGLTRMIVIAILGSVSDTACSCLQQSKKKYKKKEHVLDSRDGGQNHHLTFIVCLRCS